MDSSRAEHQPNLAMQLKQAVLSGVGQVEQLPCEKSRDGGQAEHPNVNQAEHQHKQTRITEGQAEKSRDEGQAEEPTVNHAEHQHNQARITEGQAEKRRDEGQAEHPLPM